MTQTEKIVHADGTLQERKRRHLSGRTVPAATPGRTWNELVAPAPAPTGGAKANPKHPSRKHDLSAPRIAKAAA